MITENQEFLFGYTKAKATGKKDILNGADKDILTSRFRHALGQVIGYGEITEKNRDEFISCMSNAWDELQFLKQEIETQVKLER